jgi:outer membrane receptor protein involved in Fe transport
MANSPDRKAYLGLNYDIPDVLGGDMWIWYDISYESETWNSTWRIIQNDRSVGLSPSRNTSNLYVGLDLPQQLRLTLQVNNVWDQENYSYMSTGENFESEYFSTVNPQGTANGRYRNVRSLERPRTVWLNLRKDFEF